MSITVLPGLSVSASDPRTGTTFLDDNTPVTAGSYFFGGCAFNLAGLAYVCLMPTGGTANQTVYYIGGKAVRGDGAQIIKVAGVTTQYFRGIAYTALGELVASTNTPTYFPNGIGALTDGSACVSANSGGGGGGGAGSPIGLLLALTKVA